MHKTIVGLANLKNCKKWLHWVNGWGKRATFTYFQPSAYFHLSNYHYSIYLDNNVVQKINLLVFPKKMPLWAHCATGLKEYLAPLRLCMVS